MQFIQHYATFTVYNTRNIPGAEAFILWLPGLQQCLYPGWPKDQREFVWCISGVAQVRVKNSGQYDCGCEK